VAALPTVQLAEELKGYCRLGTCGFCHWYIENETIPLKINGYSPQYCPPIFCIKEIPRVALCSEEFYHAVTELGLTNIKFEEVEAEETSEPMAPWLHWVEEQNKARYNNTISKPALKPSSDSSIQKPLDKKAVRLWMEKLDTFLSAINQTISVMRGKKEELIACRKLQIPKTLRKLLAECGTNISFEYSLTVEGKPISGGINIDQTSFKKHLCDCKSWATETWIAEEPEVKELWLNAFPFAHLANGDYLALAEWKKHNDPPVVYLSHDDTSRIITPNLASFLSEWAGVCYIGPEIWMLEPYLDKTTGYLNSNTDEARKLRTKIGAKIGNP
jgi:hypothetical protein